MLSAIYNSIRHEFGLKVLSVLAAIGLWFYVINAEDPIRSDSYQRAIYTTNVPQDLETVKIRPERMGVRVRGRLSSLESSRFANLRLVADLSEGKAGRNQVILRVIGVPERVSVMGIERPTAQVWLDHRVAESYRVVPIVEGQASEGSELIGTPGVKPERVKVTGPAGALERVSQVVARVDISGFSDRRLVSRKVEALDDRMVPVTEVSVEPEKVQVDLPIFKVSTKRVPVRARVGAPASGFVLTDVKASPDSVTLKGKPSALKQVTEVTTEWQAIRSVRTFETYKVPLVIPEGLWPMDDVQSVSVKVTVRPVAIIQPVQPERAPAPGVGGDRPKTTSPTPATGEPGTGSGSNPARPSNETQPSGNAGGGSKTEDDDGGTGDVTPND